MSVLIAIWYLMQVSNTPFPTHLNFADVRCFLASLLSAETASTEKPWCDVEARETPRPAKRLRINGTAPTAEPGQITGEETAIPDQLASLKSSIETWTAWYQSLRMQYGQPTVVPNLAFARRRLKDIPGKLSRQKDRVEVAQREHDATWADLEIARSQFQDPTKTPNANPVIGQPAYSIAASYAVELREAEDAFAAARLELEKQRSSEMEMRKLLTAAELAVEVEPQRKELQGSLHKLQELVNQPWLPETDIDS